MADRIIPKYAPEGLESHPIAETFPLIEGEEFDALVADIKANGVRYPITLHEGKVLDGRNRYRASQAAGVDCRAVDYGGKDPIGFVITQNLMRRHLSTQQRADIAAKLASFGHGGDRSKSPNGDLKMTQQQAADLMQVSKRSVERAPTRESRPRPRPSPKPNRHARRSPRL